MLRLIALAGALLLGTAAHAEDAVDWSKAETISLLLVDDRFVPDRLTLRHGVPYLIHMENHGQNLHEFTAADFLSSAILRDQGLLVNGGKEIVVQGGWAVDLYLVATRPGTFELSCADHDWAGMMGQIIVE